MKNLMSVIVAIILSSLVTGCGGKGSGNPVGGSSIPGVESPTGATPTSTGPASGAEVMVTPGGKPYTITPRNGQFGGFNAGVTLRSVGPGSLRVLVGWILSTQALSAVLLPNPGCFANEYGGYESNWSWVIDGSCPKLAAPTIGVIGSQSLTMNYEVPATRDITIFIYSPVGNQNESGTIQAWLTPR